MDDCVINLKDLLRDPRNINKLLYNKYGNVTEDYMMLNIDALIYSKNSHIFSLYKESMVWDFIDEFLKRYYLIEEAVERLPRIAEYYKNYSKFFCNPLFRDFNTNHLVQCYGDNKAAIYYKNNYVNENGKSNKIDENINTKNGESNLIENSKSLEKEENMLFNTTIREDIEEIVITQTTVMEVSIFDKDMLLEQTVTLDNLESERNYPLRTDLLTRRGRDNSILKILNSLGEDLLANMNRRINDRFKNKVNKTNLASNKKIINRVPAIKYNVSTVDKTNTKGDEGNSVYKNAMKSRESNSYSNNLTSGSNLNNKFKMNSNSKLFEHSNYTGSIIPGPGTSPKKIEKIVDKKNSNFINLQINNFYHVQGNTTSNKFSSTKNFKNKMTYNNNLFKLNPYLIESSDIHATGMNHNTNQNTISNNLHSHLYTKNEKKIQHEKDSLSNGNLISPLNSIISPRMMKTKKIKLINEFRKDNYRFPSTTRKTSTLNFEMKIIPAVNTSPIKESRNFSFDKKMTASNLMKSNPDKSTTTTNKIIIENPTNLKIGIKSNFTKINLNTNKSDRPKSSNKFNGDILNTLIGSKFSKHSLQNVSGSVNNLYNNNLQIPNVGSATSKTSVNLFKTSRDVLKNSAPSSQSKIRNSNSSQHNSGGFNNYLQMSNKLICTSHQNLNNFVYFNSHKKSPSLTNDKNLKNTFKTNSNDLVKPNIHSRNISHGLMKSPTNIFHHQTNYSCKINKPNSISCEREAVATISNNLQLVSKIPKMKEFVKVPTHITEHNTFNLNENQVMSNISRGLNEGLQKNVKTKLQDFVKNQDYNRNVNKMVSLEKKSKLNLNKNDSSKNILNPESKTLSKSLNKDNKNKFLKNKNSTLVIKNLISDKGSDKSKKILNLLSKFS